MLVGEALVTGGDAKSAVADFTATGREHRAANSLQFDPPDHQFEPRRDCNDRFEPGERTLLRFVRRQVLPRSADPRTRRDRRDLAQIPGGSRIHRRAARPADRTTSGVPVCSPRPPASPHTAAERGSSSSARTSTTPAATRSTTLSGRLCWPSAWARLESSLRPEPDSTELPQLQRLPSSTWSARSTWAKKTPSGRHSTSPGCGCSELRSTLCPTARRRSKTQ